jgi:hypothetical protein
MYRCVYIYICIYICGVCVCVCVYVYVYGCVGVVPSASSPAHPFSSPIFSSFLFSSLLGYLSQALLVRDRVIRLIHLNTSRNDMAIVFLIDAKAFLQQVRDEVSAKRALSPHHGSPAFTRDSKLLDEGFGVYLFQFS